MRFVETPLNGAWVIDLDLLGDERGWFARMFDADEFAAVLSALRDPSFTFVDALSVAAWGRAPGPPGRESRSSQSSALRGHGIKPRWPRE